VWVAYRPTDRLSLTWKPAMASRNCSTSPATSAESPSLSANRVVMPFSSNACDLSHNALRRSLGVGKARICQTCLINSVCRLVSSRSSLIVAAVMLCLSPFSWGRRRPILSSPSNFCGRKGQPCETVIYQTNNIRRARWLLRGRPWEDCQNGSIVLRYRG